MAGTILGGKNKGLAGIIGLSFWDMGEERLVTEPWRERPREKETV